MIHPKISIIVPIYNAERFIDRCMKSIYAQTFTDYEVILVNDGSTDKSLGICQRYAAKDNRIKVIDKENGGAGSARNEGIAVASGEYLAFPDVDDWFDSDMYEKLYDLANEGNYDVVFSGVNYYKQTENGLEFFKTENIVSHAYNSQEECRKHIMDFFPTTTIFDVPWNKLYKRSIIIDNNICFSDLRRCQDAMFNIDFFNSISSAVSIDKAYYNYMLNTAEDVQRKFPRNYIDICIAYYAHLINILKSWGVYEGAIREHYDSSFVISVFATACMYDNPRWQLHRIERKNYVKDIMHRPEVSSFLKEVHIKDCAIEQYNILLKADVKALMMYKYKEDIIERLRKIKIISSTYRFIKQAIK